MGSVLPKAPYCGIRPFRYADHPIFFAREHEASELKWLVAVHRGVMLYGDSGVGKSSLINAGLLPAAMRRGLHCERLRIQPQEGEEIVLERVEAAEEGLLLPSVLIPGHESSPTVALATDTFEQRVRAACAEHRRPLLVLDHFEQIVALFEDPCAGDVQRRIVELLVTLLRDRQLPVKVVLVFREDYLGRIKELLAACPELIDRSLRLSPPDRDALLGIIRGPFDRYPGQFSPELPRDLTRHLCKVLGERFGTGEVSLSEVQTICLRLWEAEKPKELLASRGVQGLLEDYLGEALDAFAPAMRNAAMALLSQMVTSAGTRNVISSEDLVNRVGVEEGMPPDLLKKTLQRLDQESRLVHCERRRGLQLYELASEFLVPWVSRRREQLRRAQEQRDERRRRRRLGAITIVVVFAFVTLMALTVWAFTKQNEAKREADAAHREAASATSLALLSSSQQQLGSRPDVSLLLALEAYRASPRPEVQSIIMTGLEEARSSGTVGILHGDTNDISKLVFSPDGRTLASVGVDGTVRLWNTSTRKQLLQLSTGETKILSAAFSPDGRILACGGRQGTISLWDVATGKQLGRPLDTHNDMVSSVAFSPDGRTLASGGGDELVRLWSVRTLKQLGRPLDAHIFVDSISFSPRGEMLASADNNGMVRLWSVRTHRQLGKPLDTFNGIVTDVAFSPNGRTIAALSTELFRFGKIQIWDVTEPPRGCWRPDGLRGLGDDNQGQEVSGRGS
jgi:WD40 repeat protein